MEEGKITAATVGATERSPINVYKECVYYLNTLLAWGRFGSISAPFGEPASRFTSAIERSGKWKKGKIATATVWCDERSPSMYKNACATE
jgi:hypothetical protein